MLELVGVDHGPDRLHPAIGDIEGHDADDEALGVVGHDARLAVDPGRLDSYPQLRCPAGQPEHEPGHPVPSVERLPRRPGLATAVADRDHVRGEQLEQGRQVTARGGGEEPAGHLVALFT